MDNEDLIGWWEYTPRPGTLSKEDRRIHVTRQRPNLPIRTEFNGSGLWVRFMRLETCSYLGVATIRSWVNRGVWRRIGEQKEERDMDYTGEYKVGGNGQISLTRATREGRAIWSSGTMTYHEDQVRDAIKSGYWKKVETSSEDKSDLSNGDRSGVYFHPTAGLAVIKKAEGQKKSYNICYAGSKMGGVDCGEVRNSTPDWAKWRKPTDGELCVWYETTTALMETQRLQLTTAHPMPFVGVDARGKTGSYYSREYIEDCLLDGAWQFTRPPGQYTVWFTSGASTFLIEADGENYTASDGPGAGKVHQPKAFVEKCIQEGAWKRCNPPESRRNPSSPLQIRQYNRDVVNDVLAHPPAAVLEMGQKKGPRFEAWCRDLAELLEQKNNQVQPVRLSTCGACLGCTRWEEEDGTYVYCSCKTGFKD